MSDVTALQPSFIEFRAQQRACPELGEIISYPEHTSPDKLGQKVTDKKLRSLQVKCKNYFNDPLDGCLKYLDPLADVTENYLFDVPITLRRQFLYAHHNAPLSGGHRGRDATLGFLRKKYYRAGMVRDVHKWVKKCLACISRKVSQPNHGEMYIQLYQEPWETVGIDLIGPFPETIGASYKYVLTVVDFFTHYTITVPLQNKAAKTVAEALFQNVLAVHGCPKQFMSDRGTEFLNAIIMKLSEILSIKKVYTSAYRPLANGATERMHCFFEQFYVHVCKQVCTRMGHMASCCNFCTQYFCYFRY